VTSHLGVGDASGIFPGYTIKGENRKNFMTMA
jgi:hypothetical protein